MNIYTVEYFNGHDEVIVFFASDNVEFDHVVSCIKLTLMDWEDGFEFYLDESDMLLRSLGPNQYQIGNNEFEIPAKAFEKKLESITVFAKKKSDSYYFPKDYHKRSPFFSKRRTRKRVYVLPFKITAWKYDMG